jgi:hypothetical protein
VEGQSKESRSLEAYCRGGLGPLRAVVLLGRKKLNSNAQVHNTQDINSFFAKYLQLWNYFRQTFPFVLLQISEALRAKPQNRPFMAAAAIRILTVAKEKSFGLGSEDGGGGVPWRAEKIYRSSQKHKTVTL